MPSLFYSIFLTLVRQTPPNSVARVSGEVFPARALLAGSTLASRGAASSYDGSSLCCLEAPARGPPRPPLRFQSPDWAFPRLSSVWSSLGVERLGCSVLLDAPPPWASAASLPLWAPAWASAVGVPSLCSPFSPRLLPPPLPFPHGPEHDSGAAPLRPVYVHAATGNPGRELAASRGKECSRVTSQHTHTTLNLSVHAARMPVSS